MASVTVAARSAHSGGHLKWWLAAGLVGADIGTSVFYSTGILLPHVGFAAPLFILLVVISMWLFKATYQEGCSVNPVNGGAYAMVLGSIGRRAALGIGSLTLLSYLATAVVSALSGAYYLGSLWGHHPSKLFVVLVAALPVIFFGLLNLVGLRESTRVVLVISAFHFLMLLAMDAWGIGMLVTQGLDWQRFIDGAAGFPGLSDLAPMGIMLGFAGAFLGITGFESAAQIVEELERPIHEAVRKVYVTIVALVSITSPLSAFLALALVPTDRVAGGKEFLMSELARVQGGQTLVLLLVINAMLTLFAAVNTAYAGATGLMTTMAQQGNLPDIVGRRWTDRHPALKGYPYVALPFMAISLLMLLAFPGQVETLGDIYGLAFLGVMISYCAGVVLTRLNYPNKIAKSPYLNRWTVVIGGRTLPLAPIVGGALLLVAEVVLIVTKSEARNLGSQILLGTMLIMALYRLGKVEVRMVQLPDLRLGMGQLHQAKDLPADLPRIAICISDTEPMRLVNLLTYLLHRHAEDRAIELVMFHAQTADEPATVYEALERFISQHLEEFDLFNNFVFVLTAKVLPGNLIEVLPEYLKSQPEGSFEVVYIGTGKDATSSETLREHLSGEVAIVVERIDEAKVPTGPGIWFTQWSKDRANWGRFRGTGDLGAQGFDPDRSS
ncbi:MAG: APC family permease [Candidatus Sericytochromatia bacterium]|nr:APC family permease [Candidatus Sericytochromatia bacterium]